MSKEIQANDFHRLVIDEYFINGFNQTQAVITVKQRLSEEIEYQQASNLGHLIINSEKNKPYISHKRMVQGLEANIQASDILNELKSFAFADLTQFIGREPEELENLPPEVRRQLKKVTIKNKAFKTKAGDETKETTITYEINDKMQAFEKIAKHIGFYAEDNRQKNPVMNLADATPEELNTILNLINRQKVNNSSLGDQ